MYLLFLFYLFFCFHDSGVGGGALLRWMEFFLFIDARVILLSYLYKYIEHVTALTTSTLFGFLSHPLIRLSSRWLHSGASYNDSFPLQWDFLPAHCHPSINLIPSPTPAQLQPEHFLLAEGK